MSYMRLVLLQIWLQMRSSWTDTLYSKRRQLPNRGPTEERTVSIEDEGVGVAAHDQDLRDHFILHHELFLGSANGVQKLLGHT